MGTDLPCSWSSWRNSAAEALGEEGRPLSREVATADPLLPSLFTIHWQILFHSAPHSG